MRWEISFAYRPLNNNNLKLFFEETSQYVSQLLSKFVNIIIAGDCNVDNGSKYCKKIKQFANFCCTFDLTYLIYVKTSFKPRTSQSSLDVLTNRPRSFQKTAPITTGLSDYHKMIITSFRSS